MGVIEKAELAEPDKGPELPAIFNQLMDKFLALKFKRVKESLIATEPLTYHDLAAFKDVTGYDLSYSEVELVMMLDGIVEGRGNGGHSKPNRQSKNRGRNVS